MRSPDPWRKQRRARNRELRQRGVKVCRTRWVALVRPEAIPIPEWARIRAVHGLSEREDAVWLQRSDAWLLARMDREAGGEPEMTECEFRRCEICRRPLLAEDAEARRELTESAATGGKKPCGGECFAAARDGRWRRE